MKKVNLFMYIYRFLFVPCCSKCTNIAHRSERYGGWENRCLNHLMNRTSISVPLDRYGNGWDNNPKYNSIFQWLWVKLKWKEVGSPCKSLKKQSITTEP